MRGYGTYINNDALCWTAVPTKLSVLFNQQLRWRSSILRDLFYTLRSLPTHVFKLHPNTIFTMILTPLGAVIALLMVITMLSTNPLAWAGPEPLVVYLGIAAAFTWAIKKYSVKETIEHPLAFGAYIAWSLASSLFITPLALLTFDSGDWGTRAKAPEEVPIGRNNP
jgi:cellulose synthase/poly-beta-1,6-N-acetylglucosamine synthase-like glycosyltransferase